MMKMPELLSPAGNFEKMQAALCYGADAVYLAGQRFGMRSAADNFTVDELDAAVTYAHERGKKVYLTLNTMPRAHEYDDLRAFLCELRDRAILVDAVIVADLGVMDTVRTLWPQMEIHISTQAGICSPATAQSFVRLGAKRLVLARELNLDEIRAIREAIPADVELEAFMHGSMCVSYSGRCMLSNELTGRDGNRGACAQPCRWNYTLVEEKRPDQPLPIETTDLGTFILSSKDMCMIDHIPELMNSGINSFKIEGRMKSAYYAAVVTNTYRMAMDRYASGAYTYDETWGRELESVSHREYATGYYFSDSHTDENLTHESGYIKEKAYLATAVDYDEESGEATFVQKNKLALGEEIELLSREKFDKGKREDAEALCQKYNASEAVVISKKTKKETINPGKLYSLSKLQSFLGKISVFCFKAQDLVHNGADLLDLTFRSCAE